MNMTPQEKQDLIKLGRRLKAARLAKLGARSLSELERQCGVTSVMLRLIENGKTNPTFVTLMRIETALGAEFMVDQATLGAIRANALESEASEGSTNE